MTLRPLLSTTFALLLVTILITGCGGDDGDSSPRSTADTATADSGGSADSAATDAGGAQTDGGAGTDGGVTDSSCTPWSAEGAPVTLGGKRPAKVYLPKEWTSCDKPPLVVLLHGFSGTGAIQDIYLGLSARTNSRGFALLVPEGTPNKDNKQFWNATDACCDFYKQGIDDVAYLRGLITEATSKLDIDPARVSLIGHSNGGFMAFRMACEASDLVSGVINIAGGVTDDGAQCTPKRAVNVLHIHGTKDKTILYAGGKIGGNSYPSAQSAVDRWSKLNGCTGEATVGKTLDYDSAPKGAETTPTTFSTCKEGVEVEFWEMKDSGHIPGFNDAFKEALATKATTWKRQATK